MPIRRKPDPYPGRLNNEIGSGSTTPRAPERAKNGSGLDFIMKHNVNSMAVNISKPNEVWYVDSGASNHMKSYEEWFSYLEKPE